MEAGLREWWDSFDKDLPGWDLSKAIDPLLRKLARASDGYEIAHRVRSGSESSSPSSNAGGAGPP